VVKCQILQECFLQNFSMQKFQNMEHSSSRTFQGLSRAWNFFQNSRTFKNFSRTLWNLDNGPTHDVKINSKDTKHGRMNHKVTQRTKPELILITQH